jgi:hypothetical protein
MKIQKSFWQWGFADLSVHAFRARRRTIPTRKLTLIVPCALSAMLSGALLGQTQAASASVAARLPYVVRSLVPSNAGEFLIALGDRIQKPGKERSTLVGTSTDQGGTGAAQLTWEVPGRLRFDRSNAPGKPLVFDDMAGLVNASALAQQDLDILESLLDDSAETFLYGFVRGRAHRFLGGRFRTDDGKTANYQGPLYDIYQTVSPVQAAAVNQVRQKLYYFDSQNKLLVKTQYVIPRGSAKILVSTEFSNWTTSGGQAFPGQIVRKENNVAVFTFNISSAAAGASAKDGLFPGH